MKFDLSVVPNSPGVYKYFDAAGNIIYVGKAKNLNKRMKSYFQKDHLDIKTQQLVANISRFEYTIVNNETEALLLELSMIRNFKPKYNILLKDDRNYPYIKLTKEEHPRLLLERHPERHDEAIFFGPFTNSWDARQTLNLLNRLFKLRKCHPMPKEKCIYLDIDQCHGPCIHKIDNQIYDEIIQEIKRFFKGDFRTIELYLNSMMQACSENLNFEQAMEYKKLIDNIQSIKEKQNIQMVGNYDYDVLGYYQEEDVIAIYILFIRQGRIMANYHQVLEVDEEEDIEKYVLAPYLEGKFLNEHEILSDLKINAAAFKVTNPQRGQKTELVNLANVNAKEQFMLAKKSDQAYAHIKEKILELLDLANINSMEIYDNSHYSGENNSSAIVYYENGKRIANKCRKYKLAENLSDFHSIIEVITRRYSKLTKNEWPDLIVVDGGKPQVTAANDALKACGVRIPVIGLAKNDRHQTSHIVYKNKDYDITDRSLFLYFSNMQEEVHNYAIRYTQKRMVKSALNSFYDDIKGIGPKKQLILEQNFPDIKQLMDVDINEIVSLGISKAIAVEVQKKAIIYYENMIK